MNHKDIEKLLSAYANKELNEEQTDLVEKHLASCVNCRESLKQFVESGQQIMALKETPSLPDMKASIMSGIIMRDVKPRPRKLARVALVAVPVAVIGVCLLILQLTGFFMSPAQIIEKAFAASQEIKTYYTFHETKMTTNYQYDNGNTYSRESLSSTEISYDGSERYHMLINSSTTDIASRIELISFDGQIYYYHDMRNLNSAIQESIPDYVTEDDIRMLVESANKMFAADNIENTVSVDKMLNSLTDIKNLGDEVLNGVKCFHYQGTLDKEKIIAQNEKDLIENSDSLSQKMKDSLQTLIDFFRNPENEIQYEYELWISKDKYLILRIEGIQNISSTLNLPTGNIMIEGSGVITATYRYNEPVIIQAPLTPDGELLDGWHIYNKPEDN